MLSSKPSVKSAAYMFLESVLFVLSNLINEELNPIFDIMPNRERNNQKS